MSPALLVGESLQPSVIDLSSLDLSLALGLILITVGISRWQGLGLGRDLLIGALRTILQLVLVGYVLVYILALNHWLPVMVALSLMLAVATHTAVSRQEPSTSGLRRIMGTAMLLGSSLTLIYVGAVIVRMEPWYDPRYLIPLFGMIVGNAMNAATLAAERTPC